MDKVRPLISVIVPCYNQGKYLSESLNSVLHQTCTNWECIVVNDGSTDDSESIALAFTEKDNRFKYFKHENRGLSATRNVGLTLAKGEWIQFLDADDYISPDKFDKSINVLEKHTDTELIISDFRMFTNDCNDSTPAFCMLSQEMLTFENVLFKWDFTFSIPIHCGLFRKSTLTDITFNKCLRAKEDWVMWIELFTKRPKALYLAESLAYYRNNPTSMTKDDSFVLVNTFEAYKYIINTLPYTYAKQFACNLTDELYHVISFQKNELLVLKSSPLYKLERRFKNALHKLKQKFKSN